MPLNNTLCLITYEKFQSFWYNIVLGLVVFFNIIGFYVLGITFKLLLYNERLHSNLRILVLNVMFGIFLNSFATSCRALYHIFRAVFVTDSCKFVTTAASLYCICETAIQCIPFSTIIYTLILICLERFIATILGIKCESKKFSYINFGLSFLIWIIACYEHLSRLINMPAVNGSEEIIPHCNSISKVRQQFQFYSALLTHDFLISSCTGIFFVFLLCFCKWNKRKFIRKILPIASLEQRYQLAESIRITERICYLSILFSILFVGGKALTITILIKLEHVITDIAYIIVNEIETFMAMLIFIYIFGGTFYCFLSPDNQSVVYKSSDIITPEMPNVTQNIDRITISSLHEIPYDAHYADVGIY